MNFHLIIPSSGVGSRFGSELPKQFHKIGKSEIIALTIKKFISFKEIKSIIIPAREEYFGLITKILTRNRIRDRRIFLVKGGRTRFHSVKNGLDATNAKDRDIVMIHDAVRPFISKRLIKGIIEKSPIYKCVIPCVKSPDTVKISKKGNYVRQTYPRELIYLAQTPQAFRYDIIRKSFNNKKASHVLHTDDSSVVEFSKFKVKIIEGEKENIKITSKSDITK